MDIETLSRKIDRQSLEIKEIKDAIVGNEFTKGKSIIEIQAEHAERLQALEAVRNVDHEHRLAKIEKNIMWVKALAWAMGFLISANIARFITQMVSTFLLGHK